MLNGTRFARTDLLLVLVVLIWGSGFTVIKYGVQELSALSFGALRMLIAAVFLLLLVSLTEWKPVVRREDWLGVVLLGLVSIGIYQVLFHVGLSYTTASNSSLLCATSPIWTAMIAAASRQERITAAQITGIALSFVGLVLVITGGKDGPALSQHGIWGDALTTLGAAVSALGAVISVPLLRRYSALRVTSWAMACGSLFLLIFAWGSIVEQDWAHVSFRAWMALAYGGVVVAGMGYVIFWKGIGEIGATRTMIYNNLVPPVAVVIAVLTLGETLTPLQVFGGVLVLAGVALTRLAPGRGGGEPVARSPDD